MGQTYFAIQARKQELSGQEYEDLPTPKKSLKEIEKDKKRLEIKKVIINYLSIFRNFVCSTKYLGITYFAIAKYD